MRPLHRTVAKVIGVDIDRAVDANTAAGQPIVAETVPPSTLPDPSRKMLVSDHAIEQLDVLDAVSKDVHRIRKPAGWNCERTPNGWGYIAAATAIIPNCHHVRMLRTLQRGCEREDAFAAPHRIDTSPARTRRLLRATFNRRTSYRASGPSYFARSTGQARLIPHGGRLLPDHLHPELFVFLYKAEKERNQA